MKTKIIYPIDMNLVKKIFIKSLITRFLEEDNTLDNLSERDYKFIEEEVLNTFKDLDIDVEIDINEYKKRLEARIDDLEESPIYIEDIRVSEEAVEIEVDVDLDHEIKDAANDLAHDVSKEKYTKIYEMYVKARDDAIQKLKELKQGRKKRKK
jgi:hypothetical protein